MHSCTSFSGISLMNLLRRDKKSKKKPGRTPDVAELTIYTDRPLMTDRLAHLLLYLGGIYTKEYREDLNVISPQYDEKRPRILKGVTDYNELVK